MNADNRCSGLIVVRCAPRFCRRWLKAIFLKSAGTQYGLPVLRLWSPLQGTWLSVAAGSEPAAARRHSYRIVILAVFLALALIGWTSTPTPVPAPTATLTADAACDFAQAVSADVRVIDGRGGSRYTTRIDAAMLDAFAYLHGFGLWQDGADGAYGDFTSPDDIEPVAWLQVTMADASTRWVWLNQSPSTPGRIYVFVFTSLTASSDDQGQHFGQHQLCATVDVPLAGVRVLFDGPRPAATAEAAATPEP